MSAPTSETLAGSVLIAGFPEGEPPAPLLEAARAGGLGGIILFKRNVGAPVETARLITRFTELSPVDAPLLVAVDQEGGRVARIKSPVVELPPMRTLAALEDPRLIERAAILLGKQLLALGFTLDFAPVLDIDTNPENPVIGDRAFGDTPEGVIWHAFAFSDGLRAAGMLSCGKHFPGHGDTAVDSHLALPRLKHDRKRLEEVELRPFAEARGRVDSIMTAHIVFDAIDHEVPATLSKYAITGMLRRELRYDGVIVSDDLEMKAIADHYGIGDAACRAIEAGCDALLVCSQVGLWQEAREALAKKAVEDSAFRARLEDASRRTREMARRAPPRPITSEATLQANLRAEEARAFERDLQERLQARGLV